MKKNFFLLSLLIGFLLPTMSLGQEYEPFLLEGKTWKYIHSKPFSEEYYYKSLVVRGDTTINDLAYKKIYDVSTDAYQYALREEGKKVYCVFSTKDTPQLIYDFGKEAGEIVSEVVDKDSKTVLRVLAVDAVKYGDRLLRRMEVVEEYMENDQLLESSEGIWIEGLGSSCGLVIPVLLAGNYNTFHSCWIGDEMLGENKLFWATGQEKSYDSFLEEEKVWTVKIESLGPNSTYVSYKEYKLMDNVSIDGISCRQLFTRDKQEGEDEWSEWQPGEFGGTTYISEDSDGKVYYDDTNMKNFLLMDFSMQEGDVYRFDDDYDVLPFVVTAVSDTILDNSFDRKPRKCIHLSQIANGKILTEDYHRDIWIEGVGSVKHGLMGMRGKMMSGSHLLMKCTQQGNVIYQNDNVSSVQGIKKQLIDDTSIYNLNGQRIAQPKKGIYIQDGKKLVIK